MFSRRNYPNLCQFHTYIYRSHPYNRESRTYEYIICSYIRNFHTYGRATIRTYETSVRIYGISVRICGISVRTSESFARTSESFANTSESFACTSESFARTSESSARTYRMFICAKIAKFLCFEFRFPQFLSADFRFLEENAMKKNSKIYKIKALKSVYHKVFYYVYQKIATSMFQLILILIIKSL